METLHERFIRKMEGVSLTFTRSLMDDIHWDARLIGIKGSRGVGKTTLLLQHIKRSLPINEKVLYVSLDNIWFSENKITNTRFFGLLCLLVPATRILLDQSAS